MPETFVMKPTLHGPAHKTRVQFDYQPDAEELWFDAYTDDETWNGWSMPHFAKPVADEVMKYLVGNGEALTVAEYRPTIDAYVLVWRDDDDQAEEHYVGHDITLEDGEIEHIYSIGAGAWTWVDETTLRETH